MTYYVLDGNWTTNVTAGIGTNSGSYLFPISTASQDPAAGCTSKTFNASYKCGNQTRLRTIPNIPNSVGKNALFDCTDLYTKCNDLTLHLGDDGILTIKDAANKKIWDSTEASGYNALPTNKTVTLDAYKPSSTNADPNMPYKRSYLNAGEFLAPGQYIGSPNGVCRLEMFDYDALSTGGTWLNVYNDIDNAFVTNEPNTLVRYGSQLPNNNKWVVAIVPTSGTVIPAKNKTILDTLGSSTDPYPGSNKILQKSSIQGQSWITIGANGDNITLMPNAIVRYGQNGIYITKTYSAQTSITVGPAEYTSTTITLPDSTEANPNVLQIKIPNLPSGKSLQVVFNMLGCNDDAPINAESSSLYEIPWTGRESLNKMGYVNEFGQLEIYPTTMTSTYSAYFKPLANADGSTYGMYGNDLGVSSNVDNLNACKVKCQTYGYVNEEPSTTSPKCVGFVYEKNGKTCQLKGEGVTSSGIRFNNPIDGSANYQYYSRVKNISNLDASCPSNAADIISGSPADWAGFTLGDAMSPTSKCGLVNAVGAQRAAVAVADLSLNNTLNGPFKSTINSLYNKYQALKDMLSGNAAKLDSKLNELNETRQNEADWSGEQLEQLNALNEDRTLNHVSQYYKNIMWTILAILIIVVIIFLAKFLGNGGAADIAKALPDMPKLSSLTDTSKLSSDMPKMPDMPKL